MEGYLLYNLCDFWEGNEILDIKKTIDFFSGYIIRLWGGNVYKDKDVKFDKFKNILVENDLNWGVYVVISPYLTPQQNYDKIMKMYPENSGKIRTMIDIEIFPPEKKTNKGSLFADETYTTIELLKKGFGHNPWIYTGDWYWNPVLWYKQGNNKFPSCPPWQDNYDFCLAQYYWAKSVRRDFTDYSQIAPYIPPNWCNSLTGSKKSALGWQWSGDQFRVPGFENIIDFIMVEDIKTIFKSINHSENNEQTISSDATPIENVPTDMPDDDGITIPQNANDKILKIVYKSQLTGNSQRFKNDCGAAVASQIIDTYTKQSTDVDDLFVLAVPNLVDRYLTVWNIKSLLAKYNIPSSVKWTHDLGLIRSYIDEGRPSIAVIRYKYLQEAGYCEKGITFTGNHYVTVVGYNDTELIIHDPLYYYNDGAYIHIPNTIFSKALNDPNCGMIIVPDNPINGVIIPAYKTYAVNNSMRNVRDGAGTNYNIIGTRVKGDKVRIDNSTIAEGLLWGHIYDTNYWIYMGGFTEVKE